MLNKTMLPSICALVFLVSQGCASERDPDPVVRVDGAHLQVNAASQIPEGMFGVHATPVTDERVEEWGIASDRGIIWNPNGVPRTPGQGFHAGLNHYIECFWDRYHPALQLMNPNGWRESLRRLGKAYGTAAAETGFTHRVEFWNEPYLNWASRPGVNWNPAYYERDGVQEGDRVTIRGQTEPTEHLIWRAGHFLERVDDNRPLEINDFVRGGNFLRDPFSPTMMRGVNFGEPFRFQGRHLVATPQLVPYDPTQWERENVNNRWWSGQQNRIWYQQMLLEFGEALKAANPDVQLAAGWGFHFSQAGWLAWRELYKPVLEAAIHVVDAVHEHHYGGDSRMVAANYEVVWNWAMARHGKSLEFWNTEAGGQLDPQRPDVVHTRPQGDRLERARGAATYTLRDILYLLAWSPDKATARAAHEAHHNGGDEFAFRLLRDLRGDLLSSESNRREIWSVASRNDDQLILALFNDALEEMPVAVELNPPSGYRLDGPGRLFSIIEAEERLAIAEQELAVDSAESWSKSLPLASKTAVVLGFPLRRVDAEGLRRRHVQQFPGDDILMWINRDAPRSCTVRIPDLQRENLLSASLRLAIINYSGEGGKVVINGQEGRLEAGNWMHRQAIDLELLAEEMELTFHSDQENAYGVWAASIELVYEEEE